jgi:hypothetical protein
VAGAVVATSGITLSTDAGTTVLGPTDETVSPDGQFVYALNAGVPSIGIFRTQPDGTLTRVGAADYAPGSAALPRAAVGIAIK